MLDLHLVPYPEWGVKPVLFYLGNLPIPSYSFFMLLAILVGCIVYWLEAKKNKIANEDSFYILLAALIGGALGAKIPIILLYWNEIIASFPDLSILYSGRTIIGGLIGGVIGVMLIKKKLNLKERKGNIFAPAIAIGIAIGRIGCFLRGCCFGKASDLPWAVDFGDNILRHPTELYESLFMFGMFLFLEWKKTKNPKPGSLLRILMISYFTFRFFLEFIRVEKIAFFGLTYFQLISLLVLAYYFFVKKK